MKKRQTNNVNSKINIVSKIISSLLGISLIVAISLITYFDILPLTFLSLFIIISGITVLVLIKLMNSKLKKWIRILLMTLSTILIICFIIFAIFSYTTLNMFNNIFDLGLRVDTYSVYVINDTEYKTINDLKNKSIGIIKEQNKDIQKKISKEIEYYLLEYDNSVDMIHELMDENIDAIIMLDSTMELLKEANEDYKEIKSIYTFEITRKVETINKDVNMEKDSFIIYLSGIDTNGKVESNARSDVNILAAINPVDKKILILNTPRDYYVELPSKDSYDKLTHAGIYGIEESIGSLEKLYDININYYARINFTTFIKVVDALDGITVDVPNSFCEQTSSRDSEDEICLRKGVQVLNGEEALALTRTRHIYADGDRSRIKNQMLVLEALIDKALSPKIITSYTSIISKLDGSVITNIDEKDITKLIKKQIEDNSSWTIETYSVNGTDSYKETYSAGNSNIYVMEPDQETVIIAKEKIKSILVTN